MSAQTLLGIALLGGLGALARFGLDGAVSARTAGAFPTGTLAVNLSGSLALGVLVGAGASAGTMQLAGVGLLGAFTTFSTWALEAERLAEAGSGRMAAANFAVSLLLGVASAWLGMRICGAL